ncbi:hypothetical protein QO200_01905 [Flavobacterium sp. Arc3]|jgi:hypothetical protein|uniref:hypothetical protein n=1 Tax=unclassified Flavobacterium TaxID=196869 RepID=UPI00352FC4B1
MKKIHFILIVLIGALLMPSATFACGNNSEKSCTKQMTAKTGMKDCCGKGSSSKSKDNHGCTGKCGNALCSASSINLVIVTATPLENQDNVFNFATKKQKFYPSVSFTSEGYSSIWLIPKIG